MRLPRLQKSLAAAIAAIEAAVSWRQGGTNGNHVEPTSTAETGFSGRRGRSSQSGWASPARVTGGFSVGQHPGQRQPAGPVFLLDSRDPTAVSGRPAFGTTGEPGSGRLLRVDPGHHSPRHLLRWAAEISLLPWGLPLHLLPVVFHWWRSGGPSLDGVVGGVAAVRIGISLVTNESAPCVLGALLTRLSARSGATVEGVWK